MTPEQERKEAQTRQLEQATADRATAELRKDLGLIAAVLVAAQIRGAVPSALTTMASRLLLGIRPNMQLFLLKGAELGRALGRKQAHRMADGPSTGSIPDASLDGVILSADGRIIRRLTEAVDLAAALPMNDTDDLIAVISKARSSILLAETDASWVVHRSVAIGQAEVALATGQNLVWVAERNACPACLAYQGHVVAPGAVFPTGLTYGDRPVMPYGRLIGPPLHPHCRCQLELTGLEAGSIDPDLAREAARSVARGLTDFQSEVGKRRSADKLIRGTTGLTPVRLPKSVLERAARNLREGKFKARPGSVQRGPEIQQRARDRARARSRKV